MSGKAFLDVRVGDDKFALISALDDKRRVTVKTPVSQSEKATNLEWGHRVSKK